MESDYIVVLVTVPSEEVGQRIAELLLENKLAACANLLPGVQSLYTWQGALQKDAELLMLLKTRREFFVPLAEAVRQVHPYQLPEIIALPLAAGSAPYLTWIDEVTQGRAG